MSFKLLDREKKRSTVQCLASDSIMTPVELQMGEMKLPRCGSLRSAKTL